MENASKALIMIAGIMITIITLSLIVYMTTSTARIGKAQDEKAAAEQIATFNMQYEAYDKQLMYGTEIMSLVNKAIDYNDSLKYADKDLAINIEIEINQDFVATKQKVREYSNGSQKHYDSIKIGEWSLLAKTGNETTIKVNYETNKKIISFFSDQPIEDEFRVIGTGNESVYGINLEYIEKEVTYSALTNFKRAIFKCKSDSIEYENGRIKKMCFEQI